MSRYRAVISAPGDMPTYEHLPTFDTAREAWNYLAEDRKQAEDERPVYEDGLPVSEYSDTVETLEFLASEDGEVAYGDPETLFVVGKDGTGIIFGAAPGYDGEHDLGLAYSVVAVEG